MQIYPRSLLRLFLLGWILMILPLLFAIGFASSSLKELSNRSEVSIKGASQSAWLSWELEEDLLLMLRTLRQFEILGDPSLREDFNTAREELRVHATEFVSVPMLKPLVTQVYRMLASEENAFRKWNNDSSDFSGLYETLDLLIKQAIELRIEVTRLEQEERQTFQTHTDELQENLVTAITGAILLSALVLWGGRAILSRLLKNVGQAVISLGTNSLEKKIEIEGPSDLRWLGTRLDWLRRRLLSLEQQRKRMLRHVSHELKTPLAAIKEGASLLSEGQSGSLSDEQAQITRIMKNNTLRLQNLIDGLLELQQAEFSRERLLLVPVALDELIQGIVATHSLATNSKKILIKTSLTKVTIQGGPEEITALINNLISNAIKFSPEQGTIQINLSCEGNFAVLDVFDEGPGIPDVDREKIFEPFYRCPETKLTTGSGLGLTIARQFAEAHQGTLNFLPDTIGAHFQARMPMTTGDE